MLNNQSLYFIAEIGLNHNGNLNIAKKTILAAKIAGAHAVKFQAFKTEEFLSDKKSKYKYQNNKKIKKENMFNMFKRLEFNNSWFMILKKYCDKIKIDFLMSVADIESAKKYLKINPVAIKVSSEDIINYPLLKFLSGTNKEIILSTGMANVWEIKKAINIFKNKKKLILMHCVSLYPTKIYEANLNRIKSLRQKFKLRIGYSDHTIGLDASKIAYIMGAKIIEKHFTFSNRLVGPDHKMSINRNQLKNLIIQIKKIDDFLDNGAINPRGREIFSKINFRRSIVAKIKIKKNSIIKSNMLALKRPGTGIHPINIKKIINKKSIKNYDINEQILIKNLK